MISIMGILKFLFFVSVFVVAPGIVVLVVLKSRNRNSVPQPQPQPQQAYQAGKYCPSCGKFISADAAFCDSCGTKIENN